jgi:hypothetical protein
MPAYTLPQCPELLLRVAGSNSETARYKALKNVVELINTGYLKIKLPEGFSTWQLIEIKEQDLMAEDENKIIEAVKVINKLSVSRQRMQELNEQALQARRHIDALFTNKLLAKEDFKNIEEGLKIIRDFAQASLRYKEASTKAEEARSILDDALNMYEE